MKHVYRRLFVISAVVLALLICPYAFADAGVFTGNGQNLHQITSKTIQLVSIDVTIALERGPFLFNGGVPGMDVAEYECTFVLRSLSNQEEQVEVGFPVDSQFARGTEPDSKNESEDWVLDYGFIARDEDSTYNVNFVKRKVQNTPGDFGSVFVWKMDFEPKQTRTLKVQYRIPMSMGLVPLEKDERAGFGTGVFGQEFLNMGQLEMAGYITSTGSSWAGNVEQAKFKLLTRGFEKYFDRRGITEEADSDMDREELNSFNASFPVRHPWWFKRIEPDGWEVVQGGVQWVYQNYKPKDSIAISYYTTPFPRLPDEVNPFLGRFLKSLKLADSAKLELQRLREVMLATYGEEPKDQAVKDFVAGQLWYQPGKDFSLDRLDPTQKEILRRFDAKIAAFSAK